jgi:PIN domain nuclease of toxin-antitoxin system
MRMNLQICLKENCEIAAAQCEGLTLVSKDVMVRQYSVSVFWAAR